MVEILNKMRKIREMRRIRGTVMLMVVLCCVSACAGEGRHGSAETPEEAAEVTLQAIRDLDLDTLNAGSDNCTEVRRGWFGVFEEREYKVFGELLREKNKKSRQYERNYRIAEAVTRNLRWEVQEVREKGDRAEIDLLISNTDICEAQGRYMVRVMEDMLEGGSEGLYGFTGNLFDLPQNTSEGLCQCIERTERISTIEVTVAARKEAGGWILHIDDEFINAFMGNINSEEIPEEWERQFEELEHAYERKLEGLAESWAEEAAEGAEDWAENIAEGAEDWAENLTDW